MTLHLRFTLLLGSLLGAFVLAGVLLRQLEHGEAEHLLRAERETRTRFLQHGIDAAGRALPLFAAELAEDGAFLRLAAGTAEPAAGEKLGALLAAAGLGALWVVDADGATTLHATAPGATAPAAPPIGRADFAALVAQTPAPRFFAETASGFSEIAVRRLRSGSGDRGAWLLVARAWDDGQLAALAALTEATASLGAPHTAVQPPAAERKIVLVRPLPDWQGHPLRVLRVEHTLPEFEHELQAHRRQLAVFLAFGVLLLAAFGLALHRWVLRPLRRIGESLATGRTELAAPLAREPTELGRVAALVLSAAEQRAALEREVAERSRAQTALGRSEAALRENLEERARLGRDLHDGVIQSLYAAGMGLAGIRVQLQPEQTEAAARLEQTRAALNETIHDVRNFIVGLEPESLKLQTFSHAVGALVTAMQALRRFEAALEIDDALAARLTLTQRVHALQIAREAISNALRHGEASQVRLALGARGAAAELVVRDNGRGFDSVAAVPQGRGLANFAQRARELGGELAVESVPGLGTAVRLTFNLNPS